MANTSYHPAKPVMFALTEQEHQNLISFGRLGYEQLLAGTPTTNSWYETLIRLRFALELGTKYFETVTAIELKLGYDAACEILERAHRAGYSRWDYCDDELAKITLALDAVDQIQRMLTRAQMTKSLRDAATHVGYKFREGFDHRKHLPPKNPPKKRKNQGPRK